MSVAAAWAVPEGPSDGGSLYYCPLTQGHIHSLGQESSSYLGPLGAAVEVVLIMYPYYTTLIHHWAEHVADSLCMVSS